MAKNWFTAYLTSNYSNGKKLGLDLGSGRSYWKEFRNCEFIGLDLPETIKHPKENRPEVFGTAENIPYKDNSFDVILTYSVLSYVNLDLCLKEMYRVLKPGGESVIIVVNKRGMDLHKDVEWRNRLDSKSLHKKLRSHGFKSIKYKNLKTMFFSYYYDLTSVYAYAIVKSTKMKK